MEGVEEMILGTRDFPIVPKEICATPQWIVWRYEDRDGKPTKVPINPKDGGYARANDPSTWASLEKAYEAWITDPALQGLGFVFKEGGGLTGIDLDKCINSLSGRIEGWAMEIIEHFSSYTEISPSGLGLHIYIAATLPAGGRRKGPVEMYDSHRFFTFTGNMYPCSPAEIHYRQEELDAFHEELFPKREDVKEPVTDVAHVELDSSDQEVVDRAANAYNGEKFRRLWHGMIDEYDWDESAADLALCSILGYWTGGDASQVERIFSASALGQRDKWRQRSGYRRITIERALSGKGY